MKRIATLLAVGCAAAMFASHAYALSYYEDFSSGTGDWAAWDADTGTTLASSTLSNSSGTMVITNTDSATAGAYSHFDGNRVVFSSATDSLDVYVDPNASINGSYTYQWDLSTALGTSSKSFLQDFIFHADADGSGNVGIWTSNGSSDNPVPSPGPSIGTPSYSIGSAGWYTFKWTFGNDGTGHVKATMELFKQGDSTSVFDTTYDSTNDNLLANYDSPLAYDEYQWFTYLTPTTLAVDNQTFNASVVPVPEAAWLALPLLGVLGLVEWRRRRAATSV